MQRIAYTWHASGAVPPCQRSVEAHRPSQAECPRIKLFAPPSRSMPAPRPPSGLARNTRLLRPYPIPMCNRANRSPHVQPMHIPARVHKTNQQHACHFAQYAIYCVCMAYVRRSPPPANAVSRRTARLRPSACALSCSRRHRAACPRHARPPALPAIPPKLRPLPMCNRANRSPLVQPTHIPARVHKPNQQRACHFA